MSQQVLEFKNEKVRILKSLSKSSSNRREITNFHEFFVFCDICTCMTFCQKKSPNWREICTSKLECKQNFTNFSSSVILIFFLAKFLSKTCLDTKYLLI